MKLIEEVKEISSLMGLIGRWFLVIYLVLALVASCTEIISWHNRAPSKPSHNDTISTRNEVV